MHSGKSQGIYFSNLCRNPVIADGKPVIKSSDVYKQSLLIRFFSTCVTTQLYLSVRKGVYIFFLIFIKYKIHSVNRYFLYIKVWNTSSCEFVRTLNGHRRGIACLQYRATLVVSGSSDFTIR